MSFKSPINLEKTATDYEQESFENAGMQMQQPLVIKRKNSFCLHVLKYSGGLLKAAPDFQQLFVED